jgi:hypothetical protein
MNVFLLDLWHDLRAKRLWLVAVALVVGLVAVPLLLIDHPQSRPPASAPPQVAGTGNEATPTIEVADDATIGSSDLNVFDPKNPFKPRVKLHAAPDLSSAGPGSSSGGATSSTSSNDTGSSTGGSSGTSGGSTDLPTSGAPTTTSPPQVKVTSYAYVVDVTFRHNDHARRYRGLRRLDMLPNEDAPLLIALGVGAKADNAVFLVDSTLKATGEGHCKPSGPECAVLYLGAGSEHYFTDENGDSYTLRVDEIRKVRVGAKPRAKRSRAGSARRAHAAVGSPRRFVPPLLTDLVTVATPVGPSSSGDPDRR